MREETTQMAQIIFVEELEIEIEAEEPEADEVEAFLADNERYYMGTEFALHCAYYLGDDEVLDQDVFDEAAYEMWADEIVDFDMDL